MSDWKLEAEKAKQRKQEKESWSKMMKSKYGELMDWVGKVVKFKGEYGIIVIKDDELFIRWDTKRVNDYESFDGGNWMPEIVKDQNYNFKHINIDGTLK